MYYGRIWAEIENSFPTFACYACFHFKSKTARYAGDTLEEFPHWCQTVVLTRSIALFSNCKLHPVVFLSNCTFNHLPVMFCFPTC